MASMSSSPLTMLSAETLKQPTLVGNPLAGSRALLWKRTEKNKKRALTVVAAVGDVSADSTPYLIGGAALVALVGTAFPILFSRKDTCPECDGAGFVRKSGVALRANAARKDQAQIVCANCNGLGKLNQVDKS
ncbi:putative Heat shock protein DnaJ, cysteine-rich [Rosa chinensis]|uniref:Putative Heat shock protein DnaJ, cysteine-rich n=1 Tax=Rosa chinensis TaxID=74649 RepID=A0A2P6R9X2_ROSCH|nr:uncharacterized protein LOC112191649 [Rosa chinensis]PRQ43233.1 putative Heat shock protein DnaJ, cysteine-rich [Rosa chinensis]